VSWLLLDSHAREPSATDLLEGSLLSWRPMPTAWSAPDMPMPRGAGRMQQRLLAQLDGVPQPVTELLAAALGRPPTRSEHVNGLAAAHGLAAAGLVTLRRVRCADGQTRLLLLKVEDRDLSDGDGAAFTERHGIRVLASDSAGCTDDQAPPLTPAERYADLTDAAWEAFGTDCGYGIAMAKAAVALMERDGVPVGVQVRDADQGEGSAPDIVQVQPR
jgi:hypothetical protein